METDMEREKRGGCRAGKEADMEGGGGGGGGS